MIVRKIALSAAVLCALSAPFAASAGEEAGKMAAPMADKKDSMGKHDSMQDPKMGHKDSMWHGGRMDKMDKMDRTDGQLQLATPNY